MTLLALLGALLVKFQTGFLSTGTVEEGYNYTTLQAFLIGTALFTGAFGFTIVLQEAGKSGAFAFVWKLMRLPPEASLQQVLCSCRRERGGRSAGTALANDKKAADNKKIVI